MGGIDKPLLKLGGESLLLRIAQRLHSQCNGLILNANGDPARFESLGLTIVSDSVPGHPGPLAGILTALEWATEHCPAVEWVVSVSGDTPFLPNDLVKRLHLARQSAETLLACAASDGNLHPTVGLWSVSLKRDLRQALTHEGLRSVRDWASRHGMARASWACEPLDPFFNINTPDDFAAAKALLEKFPEELSSMRQSSPDSLK